MEKVSGEYEKLKKNGEDLIFTSTPEIRELIDPSIYNVELPEDAIPLDSSLGRFEAKVSFTEKGKDDVLYVNFSNKLSGSGHLKSEGFRVNRHQKPKEYSDLTDLQNSSRLSEPFLPGTSEFTKAVGSCLLKINDLLSQRGNNSKLQNYLTIFEQQLGN
jgi:hypothetical protein